MSVTILVKVKGGPGSGNYGHTGRPGLRGGSGGRGVGGLTITVTDAQSIIDKLANKYGIPSKEVADDADFQAKISGGKIHINSEVINHPSSFDTDSIAISAEEILQHEFGHMIQDELQFNPEFGKYGMGGTAAMRQAAGVSWEDSLLSKLDSIAKSVGSDVSDYATKNGEEYFAEAFVAYNRGGIWRDKVHPEVRSVFDGLRNE